MMANANHLKHYPRQASCIIEVTDNRGVAKAFPNVVTTLDLFAAGGATVAVVNVFGSKENPNEPTHHEVITNPSGYRLFAQPDQQPAPAPTAAPAPAALPVPQPNPAAMTPVGTGFQPTGPGFQPTVGGLG